MKERITIKSYKLDVRDQFAISILQSLMNRYNESSYSDEYAISQAYHLADIMLHIREGGKLNVSK